MKIKLTLKDYLRQLQLMNKQYAQEEALYPWIYMLLQMTKHKDVSKLATTSSTGGLLLALQRAIVTIRPKGRYRKHFCWPAIKRYYSNLLVSILLLALLYTFELLHLLYCQSFQHNIL